MTSRSLHKLALLLLLVSTIAKTQETRTHRGRIDHSRFVEHKVRKLVNNDRHDSSHETKNDKIIFPTESPAPEPLEVPGCENLTYCESVPNYPDELLNAILGEHKDFKNYKSVDMVPDVMSRLNVEPEDIALCQYQEKVVYPKVAKNMDKKWLYVVNREDFTQGVRVETCINENSECDVIDGVISLGYKSKCKQRYIYRQLMAVAPGGKVKPEFFRFPSSCCCHVEFQNPLLRFGGGGGGGDKPTSKVPVK